jgi:hypothetical protein
LKLRFEGKDLRRLFARRVRKTLAYYDTSGSNRPKSKRNETVRNKGSKIDIDSNDALKIRKGEGIRNRNPKRDNKGDCFIKEIGKRED